MDIKKRNRLIAAGTIAIVLLLVVLAAVMVYQLVTISVMEKRKQELQQKIEEWEKSNPENPIVYSVYYDDGEGESFVKTFWNKEDAIAFMINDAMAVLAIFKESGDEVGYTVKNEMITIEDPEDQEFYYSWLIYENEIQ